MSEKDGLKFFNYELSKEDKEYCLTHAKKMCEGFKTYSFKNDKKQSLDVYYIGKIGEFVFYKFLRVLEIDNKLKILHTPFRDNYDKLNFKDDFIIEVSGTKQQIEVRSKGRNVDVQLDYECCTDSIKPNLTYIFLSINKKSGLVTLMGYANWSNLKEYAKATLKGTGNNNFKHKVNEFNIKVCELNNIYDIEKYGNT